MHTGRSALTILVVMLAATVSAGALSFLNQASSQSSPRVSRDFELDDHSVWTSTDLVLDARERAVLTATGMGHCPGNDEEFGPAGLPREFKDLLRLLPMAQAGRGALIGRIGDADSAQPFTIGASFETVAPEGGPLALGINRSDNDLCTTTFKVHVDVYAPAAGAATTAKQVERLTGVDKVLLARVPRRVSDKQGNPGDMINFFVLGSEDGMQRTFKSAGWVTVDPDVRGALIAGVLDSLSKEAYLTLPMSQLYLFNRPQDFGWAHAEPIRVAASRHHLRVWRAPFQAGSRVLWIGAATHDIGFERDQRNNGITHKIDSDIDAERNYVEKSLTSTGLVSEFTYISPDDPVREARTATGGTFHSDGRLLVLQVIEPASVPQNGTNR